MFSTQIVLASQMFQNELLLFLLAHGTDPSADDFQGFVKIDFLHRRAGRTVAHNHHRLFKGGYLNARLALYIRVKSREMINGLPGMNEIGIPDRQKLAAPVLAGEHVDIPVVVVNRCRVLAEPISVPYLDGTIVGHIDMVSAVFAVIMHGRTSEGRIRRQYRRGPN